VKTLKALSDRFVKLFLSEIPAGACIPEAGQCCAAKRRVLNCYGTCVNTPGCL
jgi:hypothetical protein